MLLWLTFPMSAQAQTIYQCRTPAGKVTLQDAPCAEGQVTERAVVSGQQIAKERYLRDSHPHVTPQIKSALHSMECRAHKQSYDSARKWADSAVRGKDVRQMERANAAVHRAGQKIAELGC
ncbi:DUF4124 domain-containing protein [Imbroritus primus]|uniref:DUF4124 domain-containing protein n=1 Tax=Imbroritus primus TaxID=3058603 RepID=UPI003D1603F8